MADKTHGREPQTHFCCVHPRPLGVQFQLVGVLRGWHHVSSDLPCSCAGSGAQAVAGAAGEHHGHAPRGDAQPGPAAAAPPGARLLAHRACLSIPLEGEQAAPGSHLRSLCTHTFMSCKPYCFLSACCWTIRAVPWPSLHRVFFVVDRVEAFLYYRLCHQSIVPPISNTGKDAPLPHSSVMP